MRRFVWCLVLASGLALTAASAPAQTPFPNRTIRILVPYAPGGLTDVIARLYADQMRKAFGQNVLIENKPGASGIIAIEEMARAKPDYGEPAAMNEDELPVFWACGVTPQSVVTTAKPEFCITHYPGRMLVTDWRNTELAIL